TGDALHFLFRRAVTADRGARAAGRAGGTSRGEIALHECDIGAARARAVTDSLEEPIGMLGNRADVTAIESAVTGFRDDERRAAGPGARSRSGAGTRAG